MQLIRNNSIEISAERSEETHFPPLKDEINCTHTERFHGSFSRTFALPNGIDSEQIHAKLIDGVLKVNKYVRAKS